MALDRSLYSKSKLKMVEIRNSIFIGFSRMTHTDSYRPFFTRIKVFLLLLLKNVMLVELALLLL